MRPNTMVATAALFIGVSGVLLIALFAAYGWVAALLTVFILFGYSAAGILWVVSREDQS